MTEEFRWDRNSAKTLRKPIREYGLADRLGAARPGADRARRRGAGRDSG